MTEQEFRFMHSQLIENYQMIEFRLRGICALFATATETDKNWFERRGEYEEDSLGALIIKLQMLQTQSGVKALENTDFEKLNELRNRRNYWTHQCFGGLQPILYDNGVMKNCKELDRMVSDLDDGVEWNTKLVEAFSSLTK